MSHEDDVILCCPQDHPILISRDGQSRCVQCGWYAPADYVGELWKGYREKGGVKVRGR